MKKYYQQHLNKRIKYEEGAFRLMVMHPKIIICMVVLFLAMVGSACSPGVNQEPPLVNIHTASPTEAATNVPTYIPSLVATLAPSKTLTATGKPTAALTPLSSPSPTVSPTLDPYAQYTIEYLTNREYGGDGVLVIEQVLDENSYFTRYLISYPSDGLSIYGFMNVPKDRNISTSTSSDDPTSVEQNTYPVVIALHGYIDPAIYNTIDYTTRYADALAREGYLVLHPNLRGYRPSDEGDNLFRVGMAVDVLNLIALVKEQSELPGPLRMADGDALGLWGHSMGGGISTRVMTISPDVDAVVLYGAMSGDDQKNFERIYGYFSNGERGLVELRAPADVFEQISPINFLDRVNAAVSIHHGKEDYDVPLAWSQDLCIRLRDLEVQVECFTYGDQPHTFHGDGDALLMQRMVEFYNLHLRGE